MFWGLTGAWHPCSITIIDSYLKLSWCLLASNHGENECPPICGDYECIEEWKNSQNKISRVEDSKNFSCIIGSLKTDSKGNDSFYDVFLQTMIPVPNCDENSISKDDFEKYCKAVVNKEHKKGFKQEDLNLEVCNQDGCNWNPDTAHYDLNYKQILVSLAKNVVKRRGLLFQISTFPFPYNPR